MNTLTIFFIIFLNLLLGILGTLSVHSSENVDVTLVPEYDRLSLDSKFYIGFLFKINPGWHIYWKNSGDSGMRVRAEWNNDKAIHIEKEMIWPVPEKFLFDNLMTYGYKDQVMLLSKAVLDQKFAKDVIALNVTLKWLECKEVCIPGKKEIHQKIKIDKNQKNVLFQKTMDRMKNNYSKEEKHVSGIYENKRLILNFEGKNANLNSKDLYFYVDKPGIINHSSKQSASDTVDGFKLIVPLDAGYQKNEKMISGLLVENQMTNRASMNVFSLNISMGKNWLFASRYLVVGVIIFIFFAIRYYFYARKENNKNLMN